MTAWINPDFTQRLAGSLIHFLWEGAAIAAVTAVCLRLLARKSAQSRYAIACLGLMAMLAAPLLTFAFYAQTGAVSLQLLQLAGSVFVERTELAVRAASTAAWTNWIVVVWFLGVATGSARMGVGWIATRRLLALQGEQVPAAVHRVTDAVRDWMGIRRPFRLLVHSGIEAPAGRGADIQIEDDKNTRATVNLIESPAQ
jgi:D-alanyl-D-alanine endopeptidase (penicillin-binding protein 7)